MTACCGLLGLFLAPSLLAREFQIDPDTELESVLKRVDPGDSLILADGVWKDPDFRFEKLEGTERRPIRIRAETPGKAVLTSRVKFQLSGTHVIVSGLAFRNPTGRSDVFEFRTHSELHAHHCRITECLFEQTMPGGDQDSRWLSIYGTHNRVDHCYFAGKRNRGTTLVVWVDPKEAGAHRLDHNHFGPRPELGENGGETIRIGTSHVSESESRTIVEENYFERCDGEAEIISNKSCRNLYRYNLFERCQGSLTLRHGHRCIVDGNIFLGRAEPRTGGVRIIGREHRVTNNYFEGLRGNAERATVCFMNGLPNSPLNGYAPVEKALVAHNTFVDCKVSIEFGVGSSTKMSVIPSNCLITHNAFLPGKWDLFRVQDKPVNFTWIGNKHQSGKSSGTDLFELESVAIEMTRGDDGILRPKKSPPLETGKQTPIAKDIDGQPRRPGIAGCDDPRTPVTVRQLATTTGPTWRR